MPLLFIPNSQVTIYWQWEKMYVNNMNSSGSNTQAHSPFQKLETISFCSFYPLIHWKLSRTSIFNGVKPLFLLTLASFSSTQVLPLLLPAGHAGGHHVHQDMHVSEDTAAYPGRGGLSGSLSACLCREVILPHWPPVQRHQVSISADTIKCK